MLSAGRRAALPHAARSFPGLPGAHWHLASATHAMLRKKVTKIFDKW